MAAVPDPPVPTHSAFESAIGSLVAVAKTIRHRQLTAGAYRRLSALAVVGLCLIIVSGGAVRLTGSGLGCPDWPTCAAGNVVAPWRFHAWVEFGTA